MSEDLDLYDKKILFELDLNSRFSAAQIGKKIKLPKETVNYRIKRLEKDGWIDRLYTIFNASLFGYSYYRVFLKFDKMISSKKIELVNFIINDTSCANLRILEGHYDLVFLAIHKNPGELKKFLQNLFNRYGMYIQEKNVLQVMKTFKLNQKFLLQGKSFQKTINHLELKNLSLDKTDLAIIKAISTDSRIRLSEIAHKLKISSRIVEYRKRRLEHSGVIFAYTTALNLGRIHREFIKVDIALKNLAIITRIIDFFDKTNVCIFAHELLGKYDLSVELCVQNDDILREILDQFEEKFLENYAYYEVSHIYKEYVINWSPFHV